MRPLSAPDPKLIVVGLVSHGGGGEAEEEPRYIVTKRRAGAHLGGQWELPGGKVEPGEAPAVALRRELEEELGVHVTEPQPLTFSYYEYSPGRRLLLLFYGCATTPESAAPRPLAADELRLVDRFGLLALEMPPANRPLIEALRRRFRS